MVLSVEKLFSRLFGKEDVRILMMGLDAAGKTTILDMIKHGEIVMRTTPTINCNVKTLEYNNISFSVWDAYGQDKKHYFHGTHGLIFVVDCNDHDRIMEAKDELHLMLKKAELRDAMLLIFANNQALQNAMDNTTIIDKLELYSLHQQGWYIQSTSASSEDGIYEGLDWLSKKIAYKDFSTAEVRIDVDHLGYLWAPATFINENQNGTLQMKFVRERNNFKKKTSLETYNSLGGGIEDISISRIRPSPPDFGLRVYSLLEKVDVHLESGWCSGVVTKICFGRKYYVRFGRDNQTMYFDYWQVRPCREWIDRFWLPNEEKGLGSEQNPHAVEDKQNLHAAEGGVEELIQLLFFGFLFTRKDERALCTLDSFPSSSSDYLESISELKSISRLSQLLYQSSESQKKEASECCIKHAKLWLGNSDQLVNDSDCTVSYARLKDKLKKTILKYTLDFSREKVAVFWNLDAAYVLQGQDPSKIFENIISALKKLNLRGDVKMVGIGNMDKMKRYRDTLEKSGFTFIHVPSGKENAADVKIIVEMLVWAFNHEMHHAPGSILLITGDLSHNMTIEKLQERGFNVLVARHHKDRNKTLYQPANIDWLWEDLSIGEISDAQIKALTTGSC